jgi:xanthine dehydrogenase accessory factor
MSDEYLRKASELSSARVPYVTAVVVRAERPTSGKPGDRAIVTHDGQLFGWIGGSCAQPTVVSEAVRALADGSPRLIRLSPKPGTTEAPEGVAEMAMTCFSGGTLDIFIEPRHPAPRLLVVGNLPVVRMLAQLGRAMSYEVVAVDPTGSDDVGHAEVVLRDVADILTHVDPLTFVVVATHGEYDEAALEAALGTPAPYIGLVASLTRGQAVLTYLRGKGLDEKALARIRFPAGLDIQARDGGEIAVSILAEIIQARRAIPGVDAGEEAPSGVASAEAGVPEGATDPVCGMHVTVEGAMHTYDHEGQIYYFCCDGCRAQFAQMPEAYLTHTGA